MSESLSAPARADLSGFIQAIKASRLLEDKQLESAVAALKADKPAGKSAGKSIDASRLADSLVAQQLLTEWQVHKLLEGKPVGFFLGKYKLLRPIGAGGMSQVYLAEHTRMHRQVAIKVLSPQLTDDPRALARFLVEARAIAALDHQNIVHAYSVDTDGARHYLVMQYVEGIDLERMVLLKGPLACQRAVDYLRQAADGLAHAHERGLVHRDVKPSNLLVDKTGVVKVLDLGLALQVAATTSLTQEVGGGSVMLGTTDYLAPEQALDSHNVDARCDIYSLGCTLYYILAGHAPFPEGTMAERLIKHQRATAPALDTLRTDVPADLSQLCGKMMAKQPGDRFQTAHEVSALLRNWLARHSDEVSSAAAPQAASKPPLPKPPSVAPASAVLVVDDDSSSQNLPYVQSLNTPRPAEATVDRGTASTAVGRKFGPLQWASIGATALAAVLVLGTLAVVSRPARAPSEAYLVLDWPTAERNGAKATLDGADVNVPASGAIEISVPPGTRHVVLTRPGFAPYERTLTLEAGKSKKLAPWWGAAEGQAANPKKKGDRLEKKSTVLAMRPQTPSTTPNPAATTEAPSSSAAASANASGGESVLPAPPATQPTLPAVQQPAGDPLFAAPAPRPAPASAAPLNPLGDGGVISHIKVLSDKVPDVSSLDAWRRSYLQAGQSDQERALAIWRSVCEFEHFDHPAHEYLHHERGVHDALKLFNVYGYCVPTSAAASVASLARAEGLPARQRIAGAHAVTEVSYNNGWHVLDAGWVATYPKPDGQLAALDEITASIQAWAASNPGYQDDETKLREFMRNGGWRKGPVMLASSTAFDEPGWLPAASFSWSTAMQRFGRPAENYENGYSQGYQVNVQLRPGEKLIRNWSNKGLHIDMADGRPPAILSARPGEGGMRYTPAMGDLAPGRVGNGRHEYKVPLKKRALSRAALVFDNLATPHGYPSLTLAKPKLPGTLVLRMPSSYVYLTGEVRGAAEIGEGGRIDVSLSDNHGLDWKPVATLDKSGDFTLDVSPLVLRRYDYRLKFVLAEEGTALNRLEIGHDIQHSQRALPALAEGKNKLSFSAGPAEGTITLEGSTVLEHRNRQLVYTDFHPVLQNIEAPHLNIPWGAGSITFPIETPGPIRRLRFGTHYRARDAQDGWDYEVSFDGGRSFKKVDRAGGPTPGHSRYVEATDVPEGLKRAKVRFSGNTRNTTMILNFRIDADYEEPFGGFDPVKVTYAWEEAGQPKTAEFVAREAAVNWEIVCSQTPVMKSLTVEVAE